MSDDYDSGFDGGLDISFDGSTVDTSFDVDSVMDAGADDFAQFEAPVEIDEPTSQILEMPETEESVNQILETPEVATEDLSDVNSITDGGSEQFDEDPAKILKQDEFDLLQAGYNNTNDILDAKIDDYHDKGYSEEEIANQITKDKWEEQQNFLNDAFPGQDVFPHVFNGFEENGAQDRIDEINQSEALNELISNNESSSDNSSDVDVIMDVGADDFGQFEATNEPVEMPVVDETMEAPTEVESDNTEILEVDVPVDEFPAVEELPETPTETESENIEVLEVDEPPTNDVSADESPVAEKLPETPTETESDNVEVLEVEESTSRDIPVEETLVADELFDTQSETDGSAPTEQILETPEVEEIPNVENIKEWLGDINPNYVADEIGSPYHVNCGSCALATLQKFEGNDVAVASTETLSTEEMNAGTGMEQVEMTPEAMEKYMIKQGAGKMYVVGFDRAPDEFGVPTDGHWFNAYNDNGKIVAIDSQNNSAYDWPPPSPPYNGVKWDISVRKEKA